MGQSSIITATFCATFVLLIACGTNSPAPPAEQDSGAGGTGGTYDFDSGYPPPDVNAGGDTGIPPTDARPDFDPGGDVVVDKPYPPPPYGVERGNILQNFSFQGWHDPRAVNYTGPLEPIELADFYDPDGTKGMKGLFINASAVWCSACRVEQAHIADAMSRFGPLGIYFVETLFENGEGDGPATLEEFSTWASRYQVTWNFVLDPGNQFSPFFDTAATPMNMVVDTRTMQILDITTGVPDPTWWGQQFGPLIAQ